MIKSDDMRKTIKEPAKNGTTVQQLKNTGVQEAGASLIDNRPAAIAQRKRQERIDHNLQKQNGAIQKQAEKPIQKKPNKTGIPDQLKSGIEHLSGHAMDDVKVHYNSSKPAQLNAHAYAQGSEIHLSSGQEKHLPHEAWHIAQQKQGRVRPTMEMNGAAINDDNGLEKEADVMGGKAMQMKEVEDDAKKY